MESETVHPRLSLRSITADFSPRLAPPAIAMAMASAAAVSRLPWPLLLWPLSQSSSSSGKTECEE